jgi:hypothetical protein
MLAESWAAFDAASSAPWLVRPSIPILYFGDLRRYRQSQLRVLTVGLNPSNREFPSDDPFRRFPAAANLDRRKAGWETVHKTALNNYFRVAPYKPWFNAWEVLLQGMGASYWEAPNIAIHTDLCSPLATDPTWSGLNAADPSAHHLLEPGGARIWRRLVETLHPHIILISVARSHLTHICQLPLADWTLIYTVAGQTRRPLEVRGTWVDWAGPEQTLIAFGPAANLPLGTVSYKDKARVGQAIATASSRGHGQ